MLADTHNSKAHECSEDGVRVRREREMREGMVAPSFCLLLLSLCPGPHPHPHLLRYLSIL